MRFKKQKRHRKTVKFYTACFGFREPFKVLCDGTFIHHLVVNNLSPQKAISDTLGGDVVLFTSKCVIEELKSFGSSYVESFHTACKECKIARCVHDGVKSAMDCIIEIIGEKNLEHFFVGTQDIELRKKFRKVLKTKREYANEPHNLAFFRAVWKDSTYDDPRDFTYSISTMTSGKAAYFM